ncbi:hypothetical protein BDB00DRAFT_803997 [Zychaea mexicana]|uniref:uncharacterized protein n=1 Tax=Zychaea mexicana TaxID=64656 RepID=UPI0022FE99F1|nr:uncharacterized protein BDB00DRAFT_803997 [Zychaea mexicana]KAI9497772.1 hypothetical protein BDB00DRAFT_803997 [Zychaea mexicana]
MNFNILGQLTDMIFHNSSEDVFEEMASGFRRPVSETIDEIASRILVHLVMRSLHKSAKSINAKLLLHSY